MHGLSTGGRGRETVRTACRHGVRALRAGYDVLRPYELRSTLSTMHAVQPSREGRTQLQRDARRQVSPLSQRFALLPRFPIHM